MSRWRFPGRPTQAAALEGALLVLLLVSCPLPAQPNTRQLEARLPTVEGRERIEVLVELTRANRREDPARAVTWGEEALQLIRQTPHQALEIEVTNSLAYALNRRGDHQSALEYALRAERLARVRNRKAELAFALGNLGDAHRNLNAYDRALECSTEALRLYEEIGSTDDLGEALSDVGITLWKVGDYSTALEYYFRAHQAFEEEGKRRAVARVLNNIGIVYRELGQNEKALEFYEQALAIQQQAGNHSAVGRLLNNIGIVYRQLGDPSRAIDYYSRSMEIKEKLDDQSGLAHTLGNVGLAYKELGRLDRALEQYRRSLEIKRRLEDSHGIAATLINIAALHNDQGKPARAIEELNEAIAIATEIHARDEAQEAYYELSESYARTRRFAEALAAFKRYEEVKSKVFNEHNSEVVAEMQARFDSERKEKEIEILQQQQMIDALALERQAAARRALVFGLILLLLITLLLSSRYRLKIRASGLIEQKNAELEKVVVELEARNAEVEVRNAEMERFTYTVSHDLKSPLITIRGFLGVLKKDALAGDAARMDHDMERIQAAADTMALLLDELLELSRIGRVVHPPEEVSMDELAREAIGLLGSQIEERGVEIEVAGPLPAVDGDRRRLLEVWQNLVENAVKYMGEQPEPRVRIACRCDRDAAVYTVRDNGIGIDPRYHLRIFGLFDRLDPSIDGTGIGLALVKRIVEVHGGRLWVESEGKGRGSTFCFTLPAQPGSQDLVESRALEGEKEVST